MIRYNLRCCALVDVSRSLVQNGRDRTKLPVRRSVLVEMANHSRAIVLEKSEYEALQISGGTRLDGKYHLQHYLELVDFWCEKRTFNP